MVIVTQFGDPVRTLNDTTARPALQAALPVGHPHRPPAADLRPAAVGVPGRGEEERRPGRLRLLAGRRSPRVPGDGERLRPAARAADPRHRLVRAGRRGGPQPAGGPGLRPTRSRTGSTSSSADVDRGVPPQTAQSAYGIEIVDVRLKRISLPAQVRESVFERMRTERARIAGQYRAEGEEEAIEDPRRGRQGADGTLAEAYAEAEKTRGEAEAEATRIYAEAHQKDPSSTSWCGPWKPTEVPRREDHRALVGRFRPAEVPDAAAPARRGADHRSEAGRNSVHRAYHPPIRTRSPSDASAGGRCSLGCWRPTWPRGSTRWAPTSRRSSAAAASCWRGSHARACTSASPTASIASTG